MQDKNINVTFHSLMVVGPKNSVYVPKSSFQEVYMKLSRKLANKERCCILKFSCFTKLQVI